MATKPRRGTQEVFFDTFSEWDSADQARALDVLQALHRQTERTERRDPTRTTAAAVASKTETEAGAAPVQGTLE